MNAIELAQEVKAYGDFDAIKIKYQFKKVQKILERKGVLIVRMGEDAFGIQTKKDERVRFEHREKNNG